ncbi:hypothetical protein ACHAXT_012252 [Thalassiosira profunda]
MADSHTASASPGGGSAVEDHHGRRINGLVQYNYNQCPQSPSLHCRNGSTCRPGVADLSGHEHLGLQAHEGGFYCACPKGFTGHECQLEVDECDGASCYNGSTCKSTRNGYYCDCNALNDRSEETDTKFAGLQCQHESTSLCAVSLVGETSPNHQFCTNHGKCVKLVSGGEPHPGCLCKSGWDGDHCEIRSDVFARNPAMASDGGSSKTTNVLIGVMVAVMVVVVLGISVLIYRSRKGKGGTENVPSSAVFQGTKAAEEGGEKKRLSEGDLDPDGSGTLGNGTSENGGDDVMLKLGEEMFEATEDDDGGDMEMTSNGAYKPETEIV